MCSQESGIDRSSTFILLTPYRFRTPIIHCLFLPLNTRGPPQLQRLASKNQFALTWIPQLTSWIWSGSKSVHAHAGSTGVAVRDPHVLPKEVHGLLFDRHVGGDERRHDGRIAVDERNRRGCFDGFEIGCDNGERVRVAFALDCCDREAMSFLATTGGITNQFGPDDFRGKRLVLHERDYRLCFGGATA